MTPMLRRALVAALFAAALGLSPAAQAQIAIDGVFFDWMDSDQLDVGAFEEGLFPESDPVAVDQQNRDPQNLIDIDIADVYARLDAGMALNMRVTMNPGADLRNVTADTSYHGGGASLTVYIDADRDSTTGLSYDFYNSGYDFLIEVYPGPEGGIGDIFVFEHNQDGSGFSFTQRTDAAPIPVAFNAGFNDVEFSIPLSILTSPTALDPSVVGDSVDVWVYASEYGAPFFGDRWPEIGAYGGFPVAIAAGGTATEETVDGALALKGAFPNPARSQSEVRYTLAEAADVRVELYDALGRRVATLADGPQAAGPQRAAVEAGTLPAGLYVYRVFAGASTLSGTLTVIR